MNTHELENILYSLDETRHVFQGVFPSDRIPPACKEFPQAYIFNTGGKTSKGEHWVAYFQESPKDLKEYFDSYGLPPLQYPFYKFIKDELFLHSNRPLQGFFSKVCGQYVIYYILNRSCKISNKKIFQKFGKNRALNDKYVNSFVNTLLKNNKINPIQNKNPCKQCALTMYSCLENHLMS